MFAGIGSAAQQTDLQKLQAAGVIIGGVGVSDFDKWTRQDVAVLLSRLYGKETDALNYGNTHGFTDVINSYYNGFISWAKDEGYMVGRGNQVFGFGDYVTAQEFATVILRVVNIDDYANAITNAVSKGLLPAGTLNSKQITRGETFSSLVKALNLQLTPAQTLGASLGLKGWAPLAVTSIQLTTVDVDNNTSGQKLAFAINNESTTADLAQLIDAGYSVQFQSTIAAFSAPAPTNNAVTSATGTLIDLSTIGYNVGSKFEYKVVISKGTTTIESSSREVKVTDYATTPVAIDSAQLLVGDVVVASGKIASQDNDVELSNVKITYKDGSKRTFAYDPAAGGAWKDVNLLAPAVFSQAMTFQSSNNNFALIGNDGKVTPISSGNVQFTIKAGDATNNVSAQVVNGKRTATSATVSKNVIKLVKNAQDTFVLTVVDQFGDPFANFNTAGPINGVNYPYGQIQFSDLKDASGATYAQGQVQVAPNHITDNDGKITLQVIGNAANKSGSGTMQVKNGSTVLANVSVSVSNDDIAASKSFMVVDSSKDYTLDLFLDKNDSTIDVIFNNFNAAGFMIGGYNFTTKVDPNNINSPLALVYSATDPTIIDVVPATNGTDGKLTITAKKKGLGKVVVTEGGIVRYTLDIQVMDTTPVVTDATFETTQKITAAAEYKLSNVLKMIKDQYGNDLYLNGSDIRTKAGLGQGTKVGTVEAKSSTTGFGGLSLAQIDVNVNGDPIIEINGANPASNQTGNIVIIIRGIDGLPLFTYDLAVQIP